MLILLLFFCSGATALIYEVVWSKYLALIFGSTVQAQTVVLAVFMGGLALGNRLFGKRGDQSAQPLALYGYLEVTIGVYAFCFSFIYQFADYLFATFGPRFIEQRPLLLALKGALSVGLLLGPTLLMGGTLPILAAWLQKESDDAGRRSARFYSVNSLGAVFGAGLAGFYLVETVGLKVTLEITALANVVVGFVAVGLSRMRAREALEPSAVVAPPVATEPDANTPAGALRLADFYVALTGGVSMGLEVLASRSLTLIFGASLQAFAIVLMAFIFGIGIGSAFIASPRWRKLPRETLTAILLLAAAALLGLLVMNIETWVNLYRIARTGLARTEIGYRYHQLLTGGISIVFLGLPAGLLGAVLPLWIRASGDDSRSLGRQVGRLLTWNTVGAVAGTLVTGFILMPYVGLRNSFGVVALVLGISAACIAWSQQQRTLAALAVAACTGLGLIWAAGGEGWRHVISSGVFRAREDVVSMDYFARRKAHVTMAFYEDAADATVTVEKTDGSFGPPQTVLRVNGKPDASSYGDLATQYLLAHLPMLARPASKDVFVLGLGSGITAGALLGYPIDRLVVAENCEPVVRAAGLFEQWNRGVLKDPHTRIWNEDARTVLKLSPQRYDVIISEPSNPWMAGVGSVFSREFYELAAKRLKPGGIMAQWFHLYEMHDGIVLLVLRTFSSVFPHMEVWDPGTGDIIILGSQQPWPTGPAVYARTFALERPRLDLAEIGLKTPESVLARQLASQRTAFAIPGDGVIQSDEVPILEYTAPMAFYRGIHSRALFQFDERTWQEALAPAAKRTVLSTIGTDVLGAVFNVYATVNPDLDKYLKLRLAGLDSTPNLKASFESHIIPTIFRQTNAIPAEPEMPAGLPDSLRGLARAEFVMQAMPESWQEGVAMVERAFAATPLLSEMARTNHTIASVSATAVRTCVLHSDLNRARKVLQTVLAVSPDDDQLLYLGRVLQREGGPPK